MSAIVIREENELKGGEEVNITEEGLGSTLSSDERVLARFGKKQQLRVSSLQPPE